MSINTFVTPVKNFGLWLYNWCDVSCDTDTYISIRKLSRLFTIACDSFHVDKSAYDTPEKFRDHLVDNGADVIVMKAYETAVLVWISTNRNKPSNILKNVYSETNFENWP